MQSRNLKSFKTRLSLLGQKEFCAWAAKELDKDKQFVCYSHYDENSMIMKLKSENNQDKKNSFKLR